MIRLLVVVSAFLFSFTESDLQDLYRDIEVLPPDIQGWYGNATQMEQIFTDRPIKTVIEVGSWLGASTLHIASLLPDEGKIYAVDHWKGSLEHQPGQPGWYQALPYAYQQFLSNVIHTKMTHKVVPVKMESLEAAKLLKKKKMRVDLIYLDSAHDTASVYQDLTAWFPYVKGHGMMTGDDWAWDTVRVAVEQFASENKMTIVSEGNFWRLVE